MRSCEEPASVKPLLVNGLRAEELWVLYRDEDGFTRACLVADMERVRAKHAKPWLRDDFSFRCVSCLCRETWFPDGEAYFGCDHVRPRSRAPEGLSS
jgi:hypothetical protein